MDAVTRLKEEGIDVGLINKATLNVVDEDAMAIFGASPFVLVVEPFNKSTGLGSKMGTWWVLNANLYTPAHLHSPQPTPDPSICIVPNVNRLRSRSSCRVLLPEMCSSPRPPSPVPRPRLLERGMAPKFARIGVHHEGSGGLWEHAYHQGYNPASIIAAVRKLL